MEGCSGMVNRERRILWEKRLAEYEASGQTPVAWCNENSIRKNQFYYWRRKLRGSQAEIEKPIRWLPLNVGPTLVKDSIAIHIGQATVELNKGFDQDLFRQIVKVLQTV
jgi:hypothetical protein